MPDDREPESDAQHRDAEEERRQHREDQQDLEQETQPPSSGPSGGKSPEEGEEGDTVGSRDYSPGELTVPDVRLKDVAEAELVKLVTTVPVIEQARRDVTIPELSLPGIDVGTTSVNVTTDAPDIAAEGKEWQIPLVRLGSAPIVQFQLTSFDSKIREPPKRRRQPLLCRCIAGYPRHWSVHSCSRRRRG